MKSIGDEREKLCHDLIELINERTEKLSNLDFSSILAKFDCLHTVKMIVDAL